MGLPLKSAHSEHVTEVDRLDGTTVQFEENPFPGCPKLGSSWGFHFRSFGLRFASYLRLRPALVSVKVSSSGGDSAQTATIPRAVNVTDAAS